ncbi:MAG: penicillin-binding protein 2 [Gemmatimonadota bacterium]
MGPESPFAHQSRRRRAAIATLLVAGIVVFLGSAFFRTQVVRSEDFTLRADENRMRVIPVPAPRGAVLDRNGELIAETLTSYSLYLQPTSIDSARVALLLLQPTLELGEAHMERMIGELRERPEQPLLLARALSFDQVSWIEENRADLPQLALDPFPQRHYPAGEAVAHLIGYVSEISREELNDSVAWDGYRSGQLVGRSGIERQYEGVLGGELGERYVEVDARGRMIGTIAPREAVPPMPGESLHLTIDLSLQRFIHRTFPRESNGAVVAIVPSTGEVLALYSNPSYDPNDLIGTVEDSLWAALNGDPRRPLLNRATAGIYPPGSTWKLATAIVGLEKRLIEPTSTMPIACSGGMTYAGRYSRCWKAEGHGALDLAGAIANSCNVYFYQLGIWLGLNQLAREGTRLGFARPTGLDLPTENTGTFPVDADWYRERFGWTPTPSEVMSLAIGQGPNAQTPVRMAQFFAALAGDGTAPPPSLRRVSDRPAAPETDLRLDAETLATLRTGMARVLEPGGTAYMSSLRRWKIYGKTGTSQNTQDADRPHAWFTGFAGAPDGEPEIAFAVVIEHGESGSGAAAPIAAKIADFYLNTKHGLETEPLQTLGERMTGVEIGGE